MDESKHVILSRKRSHFIFDKVKSWRGEERVKKTTLCQGLPITFRTQGLTVTLARLEAGNAAGQDIGRMIFNWLTQEMPIQIFQEQIPTPGELLERLQEIPRPQYLVLQNEALALSEKMKLISKAMHSDVEAKAA